MTAPANRLPELPLDAWESTKNTLHLYLQIVGKIRMALMPRRNHWWNITRYVATSGLTTGPIPYAGGTETATITFNFLKHVLDITTSQGEQRTIPLADGLSVARFYRDVLAALDVLGIEVSIYDRPFDLPVIQAAFESGPNRIKKVLGG